MTVIERLDGTRHNLYDYGIITTELWVYPIDIVFDSESIPGRAGRIRTRDDYGNRKVILKIMVFAENQQDMDVKHDLVASLLDTREPFYIYRSYVERLYDFEVPGQTSNNNIYKNIRSIPDFSKKLLIQRTGNEVMKFKGLVGTRSIEYETYSTPFWIDGTGRELL